MMNSNNNNNNKDAKRLLTDIFNRPYKILKEGDVIDLNKELCIPGWDIQDAVKSNINEYLDNVKLVKPSLPINVYDNAKDISPNAHPYFRSYAQDTDSNTDSNTDSLIDRPFEILCKRWKDLKYICTVLDNTIYAESNDKSRFFIIDANAFTVKSNNDKGITIDIFTLQLILDTTEYLYTKSILK